MMSYSSNSMPIGYKFHPKDHEAITLLIHKIKGIDIPGSTDFIANADVFGESLPWKLFQDYNGFSSATGNGIFFFTIVHKKGKNGTKNFKRTVAQVGAWKCETQPKDIVDPKDKRVVGMKRNFSFTPITPSGKWWMTEFSLAGENKRIHQGETAFEYVICKIKKPLPAKSKKNHQETCSTAGYYNDGTATSSQPQPAIQTDHNFTVKGFDGSFSYGFPASSNYSNDPNTYAYPAGAFTAQESTRNINWGLQSGDSFGIKDQYNHLCNTNIDLPPLPESIQPNTAFYTDPQSCYDSLMSNPGVSKEENQQIFDYVRNSLGVSTEDYAYLQQLNGVDNVDDKMDQIPAEGCTAEEKDV